MIRRWPPEHFARVGEALAAAGLRVVLTGTTEELPLTRAVAAAMKAPSLDLAGRTNLGSLAALVQGARLLICNNTGVSHLAAALRVPSVVIFHQQSERDRWAPLDRQRHRAVWGARGVSPEAVMAQAEDLLRQEGLRQVQTPAPPQGAARLENWVEHKEEQRLPCAPCGS